MILSCSLSIEGAESELTIGPSLPEYALCRLA